MAISAWRGMFLIAGGATVCCGIVFNVSLDDAPRYVDRLVSQISPSNKDTVYVNFYAKFCFEVATDPMKR